LSARLQSKKVRNVVAALAKAGEAGLSRDDVVGKLSRKGSTDPIDELLMLVEHGIATVDESGRVRVRAGSTAA
jgi:hypothetical protein